MYLQCVYTEQPTKQNHTHLVKASSQSTAMQTKNLLIIYFSHVVEAPNESVFEFVYFVLPFHFHPKQWTVSYLISGSCIVYLNHCSQFPRSSLISSLVWFVFIIASVLVVVTQPAYELIENYIFDVKVQRALLKRLWFRSFRHKALRYKRRKEKQTNQTDRLRQRTVTSMNIFISAQ